MSLATFIFKSNVRVLERKSFISRVESWNESWMWSSPASLNARMRVSFNPTPDVIRFE